MEGIPSRGAPAILRSEGGLSGLRQAPQTTSFGASTASAALLEHRARKQAAHDRLRARYEALLASLVVVGQDRSAQKEQGTGVDEAEALTVAEDPALKERERRRAELVLELRELVLLEGLPDDAHSNEPTSHAQCSLRGRVWKVLIGVRDVDAELYLELVRCQESSKYQKIRNDTFRTFKTNQNFKDRVPEEQLIRLMNAFVHYADRGKMVAAGAAHASDVLGDVRGARHVIPAVDKNVTIVQGMNIMAAPFLYTMPEVDAFFSFSRFVSFHTPRYCYENLDGAYEGAALMDEVMAACDSELFAYLKGLGLFASVYALAPLLSYSGNAPPLDQLLRLWDFNLAFGVHMNVVATVARVILMREKLLASKQPMRYLGAQFPPLEADPIVNLVVVLMQRIPDELLGRLQRHTHSAAPRRSGSGALAEAFGGSGNSRKKSGSTSAGKYSTLPRNFAGSPRTASQGPKNG